MRGGDFLRHIEEGAGEIGVGKTQFIRLPQTLENRVWFDGELIEREMFAAALQGFGKLGAPGGEALPRPRIDEIERGALKRRGRDVDRGERLADGVPATKRL